MGKHIVLITGATSGIGYATAKYCLQNQDQIYHVIIHGRSQSSVSAAADSLIKESQCPADMLSTVYGDIEKRNEVEALASQIIDLKKTIDIFINNAGIYRNEKLTSEYNINKVILINHLHVMLLTLRVLSCISPTGRIVFVGSTLYTRSPDTSPDLNHETKRCTSNPGRAYSVSKVYTLWTVKQLARLVDGTDSLPAHSKELERMRGVKVAGLCPGFIPNTGIGRNSNKMAQMLMNHVLPWMPFTVSVDKAVQCVWYASTVILEKGENDVHGNFVRGNPPRVQKVEPHGNDMNRAREMWNNSVRILGLDDWVLPDSS